MQMAVPACPIGHRLSFGPAAAGTCNGCRKLVLDGEHVMDCRRCNFYLCGACLPVPKLVPTLQDVPPVCVRNTFIDVQESRSPSMERFHGERRTQSCPPGHQEEVEVPSPRLQRAARTQSQLLTEILPAGIELPEQLHHTADCVAEELQDAINQIREQGVAHAVVNNVVAAVELGAAALPQLQHTVMAPGGSATFANWVPAACSTNGQLRQQASAPQTSGLWGFFNSIDSAIAGTFDKVADEMKDAAQLIRQQGMARAVASAVEQGMGMQDRDILVQVKPPTQHATAPFVGHHLERPRFQEKLEEKLIQEEVNSDGSKLTFEVPSKGSLLHSQQSCKPCAFATQTGSSSCKNGYDCQFCHLCEPGEKKRRRKTWQKNKREEKEKAIAEASIQADKQLPLREVHTAPGKLADLGSAQEAAGATWLDVVDCAVEEPEVLDWADASGY